MTGPTRDQVTGLVSLVRDRVGDRFAMRGRRRLGLYRSVVAVLLHLRHHLSQAVIAELFDCSQPTVSRLLTLLPPALIDVLAAIAETVRQRELRSTTRVDGFVVPTGDHRLTEYKQHMWSHKNHVGGPERTGDRQPRRQARAHRRPGARRDT
jgi:hypothetical protein